MGELKTGAKFLIVILMSYTTFYNFLHVTLNNQEIERLNSKVTTMEKSIIKSKKYEILSDKLKECSELALEKHRVVIDIQGSVHFKQNKGFYINCAIVFKPRKSSSETHIDWIELEL